MGSDATPEIGAGVFIGVSLHGPGLNSHGMYPRGVYNGAAERTLTDSLKSACDADGKTHGEMASKGTSALAIRFRRQRPHACVVSQALWLSFWGLHFIASVGGTMTDLLLASQNWKKSMAAPKIASADHSGRASSPRERLAKSRADSGDASHVNETGNGIQATSYNPEFEA